MSEEITYAAAGVDTAEGARAVDAIKETVHSTYRPEVVGDIGGFGGLFSIAAAKGMEDPLLVSGTDGVGTKLKVAQLVGKHGTVGIDLVAMCVNDILACGAEPLFFLDYIAIGKLRREHVAEVVAGIGEGCRQAGCALIGGEMAEHPGVMDPDDYDLSGFTVGVVDRPKMLDPESVREGDVLIGLASSGLHSNGYSLARKVCVEGKSREELLTPVEALDGQSVADALPTPSVPETSSGSAMSLAAAMLNRPPKPPMSPTTSGRYVECTVSLMASTARAPSAVSTPAAWYVTSCFVTGCSLSDRREPDRPCGQRSRTVNLPKPGHLGTYPYLSSFARTTDRKRRTANAPPSPVHMAASSPTPDT